MPRSQYSDPKGLEAVAKVGMANQKRVEVAEKTYQAVLAKITPKLQPGRLPRGADYDLLEKAGEQLIRSRKIAAGMATDVSQAELQTLMDNALGTQARPGLSPGGLLSVAVPRKSDGNLAMPTFVGGGPTGLAPTLFAAGAKAGTQTATTSAGTQVIEKVFEALGKSGEKASKVWKETGSLEKATQGLPKTIKSLFKGLAKEAGEAVEKAPVVEKTVEKTVEKAVEQAPAVEKVAEKGAEAIEEVAPSTLRQKVGQAVQTAGEKIQGATPKSTPPQPPAPRKGLLTRAGGYALRHPLEAAGVSVLAWPTVKEFAQNRGLYPAETLSEEQRKEIYENAAQGGIPQRDVDRQLRRAKTRSDLDQVDDRMWNAYAAQTQVKEQEQRATDVIQREAALKRATEAPLAKQQVINQAYTDMDAMMQAQSQRRLQAIRSMLTPYLVYQEAQRQAVLNAQSQ